MYSMSLTMDVGGAYTCSTSCSMIVDGPYTYNFSECVQYCCDSSCGRALHMQHFINSDCGQALHIQLQWMWAEPTR